MKTDTELEALLRGTLATRALEVTEPARFAPPAGPRRNRNPWLPILAAAAAVLVAVAGVLVGIRLTHDNKVAHHGPSPKPVPRVLHTVCTTTLPAQWKAALEHSAVDTRGGNAMLLSLDADGSIIASQSISGQRQRVVEFRPGETAQLLYTAPDLQSEIYSAQRIGNTLVVALRNPHLAPKGANPKTMPFLMSSLFTIDLAGPQQQPHDLYAMSANSRTVTDGSVVYRGKLYWDEHPYNANLEGNGVLRSYDPTSGRTATVHRGAVGYPIAAAQGLLMRVNNNSGDLVVDAAHLPAIVAGSLTQDSRHYLFSDGTAYAWLVNDHTIGWWAPGHAAPIYRRLVTSLYVEDGGGGVTVSGRFLVGLTTDQRQTLIDPVSGASAVLPVNFAGTYRSELAFSQGTVLAGIGFLGGANSARGTVLRLDTKGLPPLTC